MSKLRLVIDIILFFMLMFGISNNVKNGDIPIWVAIIIVILIAK